MRSLPLVVLLIASPALAESDAAPAQMLNASQGAASSENADLRAKLAASEARVAELERALHADAPKTSGLIPHLLVGPKLSLISLPAPGVGLEAKAFDYLGASFDYGFIPTVTVSNVSARFTTWKVGAKVYPFRGAFLVGAAVGSYTFDAKSTVDSNGTKIPAKATVSSTFLEPNIGWRWVGSSGFFTAVDLGWKFALRYSSTLDAPADATGTAKDVKDKADKYVKNGIPSLGLLQLGWFL